MNAKGRLRNRGGLLRGTGRYLDGGSYRFISSAFWIMVSAVMIDLELV